MPASPGRYRDGLRIWHLTKGVSMRVELLQHAGCRAARRTHQLVQQCLTALGVHIPVLVRVGDYPSPTVLVNGTDIMGRAPARTSTRACRLDVPTRDQILAALTAHLEPPDQAHRVPGRNQ
jgi:hypothetical protein